MGYQRKPKLLKSEVNQKKMEISPSASFHMLFKDLTISRICHSHMVEPGDYFLLPKRQLIAKVFDNLSVEPKMKTINGDEFLDKNHNELVANMIRWAKSDVEVGNIIIYDITNGHIKDYLVLDINLYESLIILKENDILLKYYKYQELDFLTRELSDVAEDIYYLKKINYAVLLEPHKKHLSRPYDGYKHRWKQSMDNATKFKDDLEKRIYQIDKDLGSFKRYSPFENDK